MRFDTPVYFQTVTPGAFDEYSGDYGEESVEEVKVYAAVTDAGIEALRLIYGDLKQGGKVVRLQQPYTSPFDFIRIGEKRYRAGFRRNLRTKHTFIVSEVQ